MDETCRVASIAKLPTLLHKEKKLNVISHPPFLMMHPSLSDSV